MKDFEARCKVDGQIVTIKEWAGGALHVQIWKDGRANSVVLAAKDEARLRRALGRRALSRKKRSRT